MSIGVDPVSMIGYSDNANMIFANVGETLNQMVSDAGNVVYQGPNADGFRADLLRMTQDFASAIMEDMTAISTAIAATTTGIATALGGEEIQIAPPPATDILTPDDVSDGTPMVRLDVDTIRTYLGVAEGHFEAVRTGFATHEVALAETAWEGEAKARAVAAIGEYTESANTAVTNATTALTEFIDAQVLAVETADGVA